MSAKAYGRLNTRTKEFGFKIQKKWANNLKFGFLAQAMSFSDEGIL